MPHNSSKLVRAWDFYDDFCHYYRGTIVTYNGSAAYIREVSHVGEKNLSYEDLNIIIRTIPQRGDGHILTVNGAELNYNFPELGYVKTSDGWFYLSRRPRRRRTKGYSSYTVFCQDIHGEFPSIDPMATSIVRQIWYGNTDRISNECVIASNYLMLGPEPVCTVENNEVRLIEGKEKLGRYACKLLRNFMEGNNTLQNLTIHD